MARTARIGARTAQSMEKVQIGARSAVTELKDEQLDNISGGSVYLNKGSIRQWNYDIEVSATKSACSAFVPKDATGGRVCGNCMYFDKGFWFFVKPKCTYNGNSMDASGNTDIL